MLPDINEAAERMKRRMLVKRSNALREVEKWATEGMDVINGGANNASQIKENVTEGRLLRSRLIEISKERHKFLTSHHYQKVKFKESREETSERARQLRSQQRLANGTSKNVETGTKWLLHEQLGIDMSDLDNRDEMPPDKKPRTVKELQVGRAKTFHGFPQANTNSNSYQKAASGRHTITSQSFQHNTLPEIQTSKNHKTPAVHFDAAEDGDDIKQSRKVLRDSRYSKFADLLCPVFITDCPYDIETIVQNTESLRNPASIYETSRAHILFKIKNYIKERGFTF